MNKILLLEAKLGNDKADNGWRLDSHYFIEEAEKRNFAIQQIAVDAMSKHEILNYIDQYDIILSRINPGNLKDESLLFEILNYAKEKNKKVYPDPQQMKKLGSKLLSYIIKDSIFGCSDTFVYRNSLECSEGVLNSLNTGKKRVFKRNRGSTGNGIWLVQGKNNIDKNTEIEAMEAVDNKKYRFTLEIFIKKLIDYLSQEGELIIDMPYLSRITEGELRIVFVGNKPIHIIHKKPEKGGFSATLFSGAKYTNCALEKYSNLLESWENYLPTLCEMINISEMPYLRTVDFILDTDENGNDKYVVGEINCSCVGISTIPYAVKDIIDFIS